MMRSRRVASGWLFLVLSLLALPAPALAHKPITVGDGTAASCAEAALANAVAIAGAVGGGTIKFNCGSGPVTIEVTATLMIPDNTTIDGGATITLLGAGNVEVALINADTIVTLKGLILSNRRCPNPNCVGLLQRGGVHNHGTLTVEATSFSSNHVDFTGALTNFGTANVKNSTFVRNDGFFLAGGAILNHGTLTVQNTIFDSQFYDTFGGAFVNGGTATVHNSTFVHNGILDGRGGAIINGGTLAIKNCFFSQNGGNASDSGGAILSGGTLTVETSTFSENGAFLDGLGGALYMAGGFASIRNSVFSGNGAQLGGGIANFATMELVNSSVSDNEAVSGFFLGQLGLGGGIFNAGTLTVVNSTVFGNTATGQGGGIFNLGTLILNNSSINTNTANVGGGIYNCLEGQVADTFFGTTPCHGTLTLQRTTVTENTPDNIFPW